ncbi:TonB-dependent receptor family protein [Flavobacteriaceae bacterium]|nr:TonB-dependent receptor family protein [Flavobacteriaceae bacterium]
MKKFLYLLIFISTLAYAQKNSYLVTGTIVNKTTQETVPYVSIFLTNSKQTKTALADGDGKFSATDLVYKKYNLTIEAIGYKTYNQNIIFKEASFLDLGNINIEEDIQALEEVIIRAETSTVTQKIDRLVVNVGKDLTSTGSDASDVLNNIQSVSVDDQSGELSLRGNSNVRVLIDGKPTSIPTEQLLQQIPANAIKNIEIITNPSAKYNPEGNSGIINIELVKNSRKGLNGTLSLNSQYGRNFRNSGGLNLNYKENKINWYANYAGKLGKKEVDGSITRNNPSIYQSIEGKDDYVNQLIKAGADIEFNDKTHLSFFTVQRFVDFDYKNNAKVFTELNGTLNSDNTFSLNRKPRSQSYDLAFSREFDKKDHEIAVEVLYGKNERPENSTWSEDIDPTINPENDYDESIFKETENVLINLDYSNPLTDDTFLELGLESRQNNVTSSINSTQQVTNSNNNPVSSGLTSFRYDRNIYSAYFNLKHQFDKLGIQAGLRGEVYKVDGQFLAEVDNQNTSLSQNTPSLYPSFFSTYDLTNNDQLQFSYSRRVDRPRIKQVTPIRTWGTPLVTSRGNPDLKQQFTNSLELRYNRKIEDGNVSGTVFYRHITDFISRTLSVDPTVTDRGILSYGNFDDTNNYGIEFSIYTRFYKWWRINASTDFYTQKQQGIVAGNLTEVTNNQINGRLSNNFTIGKKTSLQLSGLYRGASKNIQTSRKAMYKVDIGASYKILKDKGTITLGVSDIFNTFRVRFTAKEPFNQIGAFNWESRRISLGFVYNFGSKIKPPKKRKHTSNESGDDGMF